MATPAFQVEGARQLRATLKKAGVGVQDLKAAHKEVAKLVADRSDPRAPRSAAGSNRGPSGTLARTVRAAGTQSAAIVRAGSKRVPYAAVVHWKTGTPWISEAAEDTQDTWERTYLAAIEAVIATVEGTTT
jgi:hypothetical protein